MYNIMKYFLPPDAIITILSIGAFLSTLYLIYHYIKKAKENLKIIVASGIFVMISFFFSTLIYFVDIDLMGDLFLISMAIFSIWFIYGLYYSYKHGEEHYRQQLKIGAKRSSIIWLVFIIFSIIVYFL